MQKIDKIKTRYIRFDVFLRPPVRDIAPIGVTADADNVAVTDSYLITSGCGCTIADGGGIGYIVGAVPACIITNSSITTAGRIGADCKLTDGCIVASGRVYVKRTGVPVAVL